MLTWGERRIDVLRWGVALQGWAWQAKRSKRSMRMARVGAMLDALAGRKPRLVKDYDCNGRSTEVYDHE